MKKIIFLLTIFFMISCNNQKDEIEIIPNYDKIFLSSEKVDKRINVENVGINVDEMQKLFDFKSLFDSLKQGNHKFIYNLLVNENGKVQFIRQVKSINQNFDKSLIQLTKNWKFIPAEKNAQKVKSQVNLIITLNFDSEGEYKLELFFDYELSATLSLISENFIDEYFVMVEEMPSPIGGIQAIQQKIIYPELARKAGIEGRVYVKAFIDENGNVASAEIIKGLDGGLSEAAMEAVKATKFEPGRQRGKAVKVQVTVPILFKLDSNTENNPKTNPKYEAVFIEGKNTKWKDDKKAQINGAVFFGEDKIPLAAVNLIFDKTNIGASTNETGEYVINNIQPGKYNLLIKHQVYGSFKSQNLHLKSGQSYNVDIYVK